MIRADAARAGDPAAGRESRRRASLDPPAVGGGPPAVILVAVLLVAAPGSALGQEAAEPAMAAPPAQFRVGATAGVLAWPDGSDRAPDDRSLWGVELERLLLPQLSIRMDASYGTATIVSPDDAVGADAYLLEVTAVGRGTFATLERIGVIPFATLGLGSLVHDPDRDDLGTVSQNALTWGAGVEAPSLAVTGASRLAPLGVRLAWRRYQVELENVFDPLDRAGRTHHANRFSITAFWAF